MCVFETTKRIHLVILIFVSMTSPAQLDIGIKKDNTESVGNRSELREKRWIEAVGAKLGQLGLKVGRHLPYYFRARKAKSILVADAELVETKAAPAGHKVFKFEKEGGCKRARVDFSMIDAADIVINAEGLGDMDGQLLAHYEGVVGGEKVNFRLNTLLKAGCWIQIGRAPTPGRKSGDVIIVHYRRI